MLIQIIYNEKIKDVDYLAATDEYQKRLSAFTKIILTSSKEYIPDPKEYVIQLRGYGDTIPSEELASQLSQCMVTGFSTITLSLTPVSRANTSLCISKMKLSEPLLLTVLHEQLYRAFMIMNNRTYHK